MKVRSITYFHAAGSLDEATDAMRTAGRVLATAKSVVAAAGFEVQTVRAATNSFEDFLPAGAPAADAAKALARLEAAAEGVDLVSVGPAVARLDVMELALGGETQKTFFTVPVALTDAGVPDRARALDAAGVVCRLGAKAPAKTSQVPQLFRLTVTSNLDAGTPYFPGAFWQKGRAPALAVALEDSGLVKQALAGAASLDAAKASLREAFEGRLAPLEAAAQRAAQAAGVEYAGIDCSVASAADPAESMVEAYESLGLGGMGGAGTLSISAMITSVLKSLPVKRCGYSGLMMPVTEDAGLARRAVEGRLSVQQLLFYSAVCGTGIDTVPVEGSTTPDRLAAVYMDMCSLAFRLGKPLSARLWPVAGKEEGDMTEVDNPFFVNSRVLSVDPVGPRGSAGPGASAPQAVHAGLLGAISAGPQPRQAAVLADTREVLVLRLDEGAAGVALVLRNSGPCRWPEDTRLCRLGVHGEEEGEVVMQVPDAQPGESATLVLAETAGRFRLAGGHAQFGPVLILVA